MGVIGGGGGGGGSASEVNAHKTTSSDVATVTFAMFQSRRKSLQRSVQRGVHTQV